MLGSIWVISYKHTLLHLLIIRLGSFLIQDVVHYKIPKNIYLLVILSLVSPSFFWNYFIMVLTSYEKFVLEVICYFHYLCPKSIRESTINQYQVFHYYNNFLTLFGQSIFFMHVWCNIFYDYTLLFAKVSKFCKDKFSTIIYLESLQRVSALILDL